jgi:hypothetical protein
LLKSATIWESTNFPGIQLKQILFFLEEPKNTELGGKPVHRITDFTQRGTWLLDFSNAGTMWHTGHPNISLGTL